VVEVMSFDDAKRLIENEIARLRGRMSVTEDRGAKDGLAHRITELGNAVIILKLADRGDVLFRERKG
jgi:hypothetical protein